MKLYRDRAFAKWVTLENLVGEENRNQIKKWGFQNRTLFEWLAFLTEEVGELSQAISENHYRDGIEKSIKKEAIQVATLALKIAEMVEG